MRKKKLTWKAPSLCSMFYLQFYPCLMQVVEIIKLAIMLNGPTTHLVVVTGS